MFEGACLVVAVYDQQDATSRHDGADAYGKGGFRNEVDIVVEEARVGDDGIVCQRFHASARCQRRTGLVESDMSVGAYAAQEEIDAAVGSNLFFVATTFGHGVSALPLRILTFSGRMSIWLKKLVHMKVW